MTAKALFFPNYLGGGFGHIGRCLALADAWVKRGGKAIFSINGPHKEQVIRSGHACHAIETPRVHQASGFSPAYLRIPNMSYQIVRDGFDHRRVVETALAEILEIIDQTQPDVLIGDGYPLTWLVGLHTGIPVVQFVKSIANPWPQPLTWWESPPEGAIYPDPGPIFTPVLKRYGQGPLSCPEALLAGDLLLIPSIPALDPIPDSLKGIHYVGAINRPPVANEPAPEWLTQLDPTKPTIYVTVGGAAGHDGSGDFFRIIAEGLSKVDAQVIVSTGGKLDPAAIPYQAPNIRWERWVPTQKMLKHCNLVIFHGGYGTRMQVIEEGLPSIVIPFHSEQEYSGRQMAAAGATELLPYSEAPYNRITARWKGGKFLRRQKYTVHMRVKATLQPAKLHEVVEQALGNQKLQRGAQTLREELRSYQGCEQALDLIKSQLMISPQKRFR